MITRIKGNAPFQVLTSSFSISPSLEGYALQISADGVNYSNLFSVPANTTRLVTNVAANSYYRLSGNNSEVVVNWQKSCGGGGSADLSDYYTKEETDERIQEAVTSGVSLDEYWTSAQTKDYVDNAVSGITVDLSDYYTSGQTDAAIAAATANLVTSGDVATQIEGYDYATKSYVDGAISGVSVDLSGYYTSGQTDAAIAAATANLVTSGDVKTQIESYDYATEQYVDAAISGISMDGYWTSAQTKSYVDNTTAGFVTSGAVETQIDAALSGFTPSGVDVLASLDLNTFWNEKSFYVSIDDINYDALSAFFDYDAEDPDKTPASYVYMVAVNGSDLMVETDNIGLQADIDIDEKSVTITDIPAGQYVMKLWKDTPEHSFVDEPFPVYFGTGEDPNPTYSIMGTDTEEDINITYSGVTYTLPFNRATRIFNKSFQDEGSVFIKRSQEDSGYVWYFEKDVKYLVLVFNGNSMEIRIEYKDEPVRSETITNIWTGTQAEYDLIANPDPNTFYVITGTTA